MQVTDEMVEIAARILADDLKEIGLTSESPVANANGTVAPLWTTYMVVARAALTAALSDKKAVEVKSSEWHRTDRPGGGSVMLYTLREERRRHGEPVMTNDVMINIDRGTGSSTDIEPIVQRIRSALVDVPAVEPVAWTSPGQMREIERGSNGTVTRHGDEFMCIPLYTRPPHRGEDSAEVIPAGLVERCAEILEWKKTGKLPGNSLRELGQSIANRLGNSLFIDNGLNQAELATVDEALKLILALADTRSGSATGQKGWAE